LEHTLKGKWFRIINLLISVSNKLFLGKSKDQPVAVTPTVRLLNQLMESFKRIDDLKDIVPVALLQPVALPQRLRKAI